MRIESTQSAARAVPLHTCKAGSVVRRLSDDRLYIVASNMRFEDVSGRNRPFLVDLENGRYNFTGPQHNEPVVLQDAVLKVAGDADRGQSDSI